MEPITKKHYLPKLKYKFNELEPFIDEQTVELHYTKHHASYVNGLNNAEELLVKSRINGDFSLVKQLKAEIAFHGSGHILHSIYWLNMTNPYNFKNPSENLINVFNSKYGSFEVFIKEFKACAMAVEGSGWTVLTLTNFNSLEILNIEKHQELVLIGATPLLVLDVWEHAYYLKYKNNRESYIDNWFKLVDWSDVELRYNEALKMKMILDRNINITKY